MGHGEIHSTARDLAKFGLLYLNGGEYEGTQIIPADWVHDSLRTYSEDAWTTRVGRSFRDIGYGYQWWSVRAGDHRYALAWGHGGQQIVLVAEFDMVIVVTADPPYLQHGDGSWRHEKANLNLVADFVASLPTE
jgi:CubicO group peptidase (beta-lactamase class C family)